MTWVKTISISSGYIKIIKRCTDAVRMVGGHGSSWVGYSTPAFLSSNLMRYICFIFSSVQQILTYFKHKTAVFCVCKIEKIIIIDNNVKEQSQEIDSGTETI